LFPFLTVTGKTHIINTYKSNSYKTAKIKNTNKNNNLKQLKNSKKDEKVFLLRRRF